MEKFCPSFIPLWVLGGAGFLVAAMALHFLLQLPVFGINWLLPYAALITIFLLYLAATYFFSRNTTYSLEGESIVMEKGNFSSEKKVIPIKSVDNVHVKVSVLGRLFGVCDVFIDTPGGIGYEMAMHDVPKGAADVLLHSVEQAKREN